MSEQRRFNKETTQGTHILTGIVEAFFGICISKKLSPAEIKEEYKKSETTWIVYVDKRNALSRKQQPMLMMQDAFESTIHNAANRIIKQKISPSVALAMLRVLRHIDGKSWLHCTKREFPFWFRHIVATYGKKKRGEVQTVVKESAANTTANYPDANLTVTVTKKEVKCDGKCAPNECVCTDEQLKEAV